LARVCASTPPLGRYFGLTLRGTFITGTVAPTADNPTDHIGGRLDFVGKSPVFLNLLRLYGGGGVEVFSATGPNINHNAQWSGGGQFGFEFFINQHAAFFLEVGGHGGIDTGLPGGQTIVVGTNFYPFSS
jgi:hypothetical protein